MEKTKEQSEGSRELTPCVGESAENFVQRLVSDSNQLAQYARNVLDITRQINTMIERIKAIDRKLRAPHNAQWFSDSFADNDLREERDQLILKAEELELNAERIVADFKSKKPDHEVKKEYIM